MKPVLTDPSDLVVDDKVFSTKRAKDQYCKDNNLVKLTNKESLEHQRNYKKGHKKQREQDKKNSWEKATAKVHASQGIKLMMINLELPYLICLIIFNIFWRLI